MSELHPVEAGWRKYRNIRNTLDLLAQCFEQREAYLRFLRSPEFPPEVVLPMPLVETFVRQRSNNLQLDAFGISTLIISAHVWAAYRESKTIYEIEPSLMACLEDTPWPVETPTAALVRARVVRFWASRVRASLHSTLPLLTITSLIELSRSPDVTFELIHGGFVDGMWHTQFDWR